MTIQNTLQTKIAAASPVFQQWMKKIGKEGLERIERGATIALLVVGGAYLASSITSGLLMNSMMTMILTGKSRPGLRGDSSDGVDFVRPAGANMREVTKVIKERNLFNSEGKFPEEKFGQTVRAQTAVFDIDGPCRPTTLPIELLGTIFLGDRLKSIATVKDKGYSEADIYRVGDEIFGASGATIAAVERQFLIINNQGAKECIELDKSKKAAAGDGFPSTAGGDFSGNPTASAGGGSEIVLESSYVESELGPGFAKIMDAARFVPNTVDGQVNGFKMFAIRGGSLLSRIGLQNDDVVTQVNDTSLKQPEQGFAFYQALQDEKEVRIQVLRGGTTPVNIMVRIK